MRCIHLIDTLIQSMDVDLRQVQRANLALHHVKANQELYGGLVPDLNSALYFEKP